MIWFSAESASIWTSPSACGPIAIPTMRNTATSGILIFCANRPARVPTARISPHESSVCLAISREADVSTPRPTLVANVDDPARLRVEHHHAIVDDRIVMIGHAVTLRHRIGFVGAGPQFPADRDFILIAVG